MIARGQTEIHRTVRAEYSKWRSRIVWRGDQVWRYIYRAWQFRVTGKSYLVSVVLAKWMHALFSPSARATTTDYLFANVEHHNLISTRVDRQHALA
jgi:hypothetical protein